MTTSERAIANIDAAIEMHHEAIAALKRLRAAHGPDWQTEARELHLTIYVLWAHGGSGAKVLGTYATRDTAREVRRQMDKQGHPWRQIHIHEFPLKATP